MLIQSSAQSITGLRSADATFNLFNWHRNNEEGLWLEEAGDNIVKTRLRQSHPWIEDESDEECAPEEDESVSCTEERLVRVRDWIAEMNKCSEAFLESNDSTNVTRSEREKVAF